MLDEQRTTKPWVFAIPLVALAAAVAVGFVLTAATGPDHDAARRGPARVRAANGPVVIAADDRAAEPWRVQAYRTGGDLCLEATIGSATTTSCGDPLQPAVVKVAHSGDVRIVYGSVDPAITTLVVDDGVSRPTRLAIGPAAVDPFEVRFFAVRIAPNTTPRSVTGLDGEGAEGFVLDELADCPPAPPAIITCRIDD